MLFGWTGSLQIDVAGQPGQGEHYPAKQIALSVWHAFLHRDANFTGIICPASQDLYLLVRGKAVVLKQNFGRCKD